MNRYFCGFSMLMVLLVTGCVSLEQAAPPVAMLGLPMGGSKIPSMERGRDVYITLCAKCHSVEPVKKYTPAEWATIMPEMVEKTKLSSADDAAVNAYVSAVLRL